MIKEWGAHNFYPDCRLMMVLKTTKVSSTDTFEGADVVRQRLEALVRHEDIQFNPNLGVGGIKSWMDKDNLVIVLVCGSLHKDGAAIGIFEQKFGLIRDPLMDNSWRIRITELKIFEQAINRLPTLEDTQTKWLWLIQWKCPAGNVGISSIWNNSINLTVDYYEFWMRRQSKVVILVIWVISLTICAMQWSFNLSHTIILFCLFVSLQVFIRTNIKIIIVWAYFHDYRQSLNFRYNISPTQIPVPGNIDDIDGHFEHPFVALLSAFHKRYTC